MSLIGFRSPEQGDRRSGTGDWVYGIGLPGNTVAAVSVFWFLLFCANFRVEFALKCAKNPIRCN